MTHHCARTARLYRCAAASSSPPRHQDLEERHAVEIKAYKQRVKHLLYEQQVCT
jgi:hypothetical protein